MERIHINCHNLNYIDYKFNNASPYTDAENAVQSKYYNIDKLQNMKIPNKDKSLTLFHITYKHVP